MTNTNATPLTDADLDAVAGADKRHKDWIIIESMSAPVTRAAAGDANLDGQVDASDFLTWQRG